MRRYGGIPARAGWRSSSRRRWPARRTGRTAGTGCRVRWGSPTGRRGRRPGGHRGGPLRHQLRPGIGALVSRRVVDGRPGTGPGPGRTAAAPGGGGRRQRRASRRGRRRGRRQRHRHPGHPRPGPGRAARHYPRRAAAFRRAVSGIPTARFRGRLVQMAANAGLAVIVADAAYTSRWGAEHWLAPLQEHHPEATGHHAAALVTGRRGLGYRARRRVTGNQLAPEEAARPAQTRPRTPPAPMPAPRNPATPRGPRHPPGNKTGRPHRSTAGNQAAQDRPGRRPARTNLQLAQQERFDMVCGTADTGPWSGDGRW
jgi:hypothetical protein